MTFISVTQSDDGYVRHRTSRCMTSLIYLFLKRNTRKKDKGHLLGGEVLIFKKKHEKKRMKGTYWEEKCLTTKENSKKK